MIVNVASNCGFTDVNYRELQDLQKKYHGQAFSVIAFPCNQFGGQEPGTIHEIEEFAHSKYKVTMISEHRSLHTENSTLKHQTFVSNNSTILRFALSILGLNLRFSSDRGGVRIA